MDNTLIKHIRTLSDRIKDFCNPLNAYLGLPFFNYCRVFNKEGTFINIANDDSIIEDYYSAINYDSLYFKDFLGIQSKYKFILWPDDPSNKGMHIYFNKNYWYGITIITENNDSLEGFCFLSDKNHPRTREFFIKNAKLLEQFIIEFKIKFEDCVIKEALSHKAKFQNGCNFILPEQKIQEPIDKRGFLKAIGSNGHNIDVNGKFVKLTTREFQCLELISQGLTIKGIGNTLLISPRTAENHINNIRQKTGYHCKDLLVRLYHNCFD